MERDLPIKPSGPAQCFALPCFFPVSSVECGSALLCRFCFPVSSVECGSGFATAALVFPFWSAAVLCSAAFVFLFLLWSAAVLCSAAFVFLFLLWSAAVLCSAAFVFLLWSAAGDTASVECGRGKATAAIVSLLDRFSDRAREAIPQTNILPAAEKPATIAPNPDLGGPANASSGSKPPALAIDRTDDAPACRATGRGRGTFWSPCPGRCRSLQRGRATRFRRLSGIGRMLRCIVSAPRGRTSSPPPLPTRLTSSREPSASITWKRNCWPS